MYIGNDLQIANPSYKVIDDISSSFNGSATSFALNVKGATPVPFPINEQQVMISVNGVIQEPDATGSAGFKLLGSNIIFSSAPANGNAFFGVILAGADYVTAGSEFPDGTVTAPSFTFESDLDSGFFRSGSGAVGYSANGVQKALFDGNGLTVTGTCTATAFSGNGANLTNVTANAAAASALTGGTLASGVTASSLTSVGTLTSLSVTGNLTVDTNTLHVNASNNRVGIRSTSPTGTLSVHNSDDSNLNVFEVYNDNGNMSGSFSQSSAGDGTLGLRINGGDNKVFFRANGNSFINGGNVGIGTTSPSDAVEISHASDPAIRLHYGTNSGYSVLGIDSANNLTFDVDASNAGSSSFCNFKIDGSERMRIDSSGRLLIGTTTEGHTSADDLTIATSGVTGITIRSGTSSNGQIYFSDGTSGDDEYRGIIRYSHSSNSMSFHTTGGTGLTIDSSLNSTFAGTVSDSKGNLRLIPANNQSSAYTLTTSDIGKHVSISSGGITVPQNIGQGAAITIINNSGSDQTITQGSGVTMYNTADATTGNRTLAGRGMATILFVGNTDCYISGAGLS